MHSLTMESISLIHTSETNFQMVLLSERQYDLNESQMKIKIEIEIDHFGSQQFRYEIT
jgi:hypothetical protein